jgi:putative transposase
MPHEIVSFDDEATKGYVGKLVAKTVEEALDALPDEEADQLVNAGRYERTDERQAYGGGHYRRRLVAGAGELEPSVPKLRGATSATKVIERYRRRESSVGEAMMETCLAGVSTRRIEDAGEILWGSSASKGTVSNLNQKAFAKVEEWRTRLLTCAYPYACVDGTYLKRNWGGAHGSVAILIATGANEDGCREVIGCAEGCTESADSWREFLLSPRDRGLRGVGMVAGDKSAGMMGALAEVFPEAPCQRCTVHFHRNALSKVPARHRKRVAAQLKAIHAQESLGAGLRKAEEVARELETSRLADAAKVIRGGAAETLAYARFPMEHWRRARTNNGIERLNREVKRRANAVGSLPDGRSAMMLAAARCEYVADGTWGKRRYLDISLLDHWDERSVSTE